jgi:hypothetical protein
MTASYSYLYRYEWIEKFSRLRDQDMEGSFGVKIWGVAGPRALVGSRETFEISYSTFCT